MILGTVILIFLAFLARYLDHDFWTRAPALVSSILIARLTSRIICPLAAIVVKWVVIGRYKPGVYRMQVPHLLLEFRELIRH